MEKLQGGEKKWDCLSLKLYVISIKYYSAISQEIAKAGVMAQPVKGLPCNHDSLSWLPRIYTKTLAVVMHTSNYRGKEADVQILQLV